ncbi:unnamed protein product [Urochloa decumbens]|uniref:Uncharacterized protein n=1 Tax=Urochloa decumbens TaxID=240449 RepID=A0ABC8ZXM5_9POAL
MAEVIVVVGWFLSPVIGKLIDSARRYAAGRYNLFRGLPRRLQRLAEDLEAIRDVVDGAREEGFVTSAPVVGDLWQLKDAIHDVEETLDTFYVYLQENQRHNAARRAFEMGRQVIGNNSYLNKLMRLVRRLDELRDTLPGILHGPQRGARGHPARRATGPMPRKENFFGYDAEYQELLSRVKDNGDARVVAIIGHGGTGKTELARRLFHDQQNFPRNHFDLRIWVCVYGKFSETDLLSEIWKSAFGSDPAAGEMNVASLQVGLTEKVERYNRRYLLVLDDVCTDERAASDLSRRTAWNANVIQGNAGKLHGSPLAAEEAGVMLERNHNSGTWDVILNRDLYQGVFKAHLSSYHDLPPHLQRCFAFCGMFPKGWSFEPEKLIMMWIALGLVESREEAEEDVARGYFDALVQRSLFQEASLANDNSEATYYKIHEHIHSMIRRVLPAYYLSIDGNSAPTPTASSLLTVRHLSVTTSRLHQLMDYFPGDSKRRLRTFLVFNDDGPLVGDIVDRVLRKFKGVRVLDISDTRVDELPADISRHNHVRYLGLPNTIQNLGACFPMFLLLQTLYLKAIARMGSIGRLDKLKGSVEFDANNDQGNDMSELGRLNSLRRLLSIKGLQAVDSTQEASRAQLHRKQHLKILKLEWEQRNQNPEEGRADLDVLQGLQPHSNLEKLHITGYLGMASPNWLRDPGVMWNLRSLYLRSCRRLQAIPPVGRLPHLELLYISDLCSVERIDHAFCSSGRFESLKKMVVDNMAELVSWDAEPNGDGIYAPVLFPQLREVVISNCPRLSFVLGLLCCRNSLTHLSFERCPAVNATFRRSLFPSLGRTEDIQACPGLRFEEPPATWFVIFIFVFACIKNLFATARFVPHVQ